jgi:hypothetical protein
MTKPTRHDLLAALLLLPVSILIVQLQLEMTIRPADRIGLFHGYFDGSASSIEGGRPLTRWMINAITEIAPESLDRVRVYARVETFILWIGLLATYVLGRTFGGPTAGAIAAFLTAAFIPWGFLEVGYRLSYPYDIPAFFFSAVSLCAIATRRFWVLAALIFIGTFAKETTLWLIPAYYFFEAGREIPARWLDRKLLLQCALLLGLFTAVYFSPRVVQAVRTDAPLLTVSPIIAGGEEGKTTPRYISNLRELVFLGRQSFSQNIYWFFLLFAPAILRYRSLPPGLRRLHWAIPINLLPLFFFTNIYEMRDYNEILPLGATGAACALLGLARQSEPAPN